MSLAETETAEDEVSCVTETRLVIDVIEASLELDVTKLEEISVEDDVSCVAETRLVIGAVDTSLELAVEMLEEILDGMDMLKAG
jgi:hypothetical protein